jgi:2-polyprenyl-3-methyl-5-hydroxy-6-metoxy-1,4-benzoquinol methylase
MGTDRDWEKWGASDPYFGVLSEEQFRSRQLDPAAREAFFRIGEQNIAGALDTIHAGLDAAFAPRSALDFGCGVGRLVIPLARRAERVVGVDISPSMIAEARRNCAAEGLGNVDFVLSDDTLSRVEGEFDLIHTRIVLPHIPWARGRTILQALAGHVAPGGVLAAQFLFNCTAPALARALTRARYTLPPVNWARNVLRGRPMLEPAMQLHVYDAATVKADLRALGFHQFVEETEAPRAGFPFESLFLFARRAGAPGAG